MRTSLRSVILSSAIALTACGGGGDDKSVTERPVGLWNGTTSNNRAATALTLSDGTYWLIYSAVGSPSAAGGIIYGHSISSNRQFTSSDMRDFNFEGQGVLFGELNGSYVAGTNIQGIASYAGGSGIAFAAAYDASNERRASLGEIAGSYSGTVSVLTSTQAATLVITSDGAVTGTSSGCSVTGSVLPRTDAFAYDLQLTFGAAPCYFAGQSFSGIAVFNPANRQLIAASPNAAKSDGYLFFGSR